jgi:hypothetical protein
MTVSRLMALLAKHDGTCEVVLAKDSEGNEFSPLEDLESRRYVPDTTWSGYLVDDPEDDDVEEEEYNDAVDAVVLWPVN